MRGPSSRRLISNVTGDGRIEVAAVDGRDIRVRVHLQEIELLFDSDGQSWIDAK